MYYHFVVNCSQIFCTFAVETTLIRFQFLSNCVVNCSQIFCTFAVETTTALSGMSFWLLWIALKFFVLLQSKQRHPSGRKSIYSCELLSNFLYFCSRNNCPRLSNLLSTVVNCSQIFCTFAVETTKWATDLLSKWLWIALKFFVLLQSKQRVRLLPCACVSCELLSNFLYFCSRNNATSIITAGNALWIALKFFVLLQSKQRISIQEGDRSVVNCSQIFCTFAVETTNFAFTKF